MPEGVGTSASAFPQYPGRGPFASGDATAPRTPLRRLTVWNLGTALVCLLVALPLLAVFFLTFGDNQDIWSHLAATVLPDYLVTTGLLMLGVGIGTLLTGVSTAWLPCCWFSSTA